MNFELNIGSYFAELIVKSGTTTVVEDIYVNKGGWDIDEDVLENISNLLSEMVQHRTNYFNSVELIKVLFDESSEEDQEKIKACLIN